MILVRNDTMTSRRFRRHTRLYHARKENKVQNIMRL